MIVRASMKVFLVAITKNAVRKSPDKQIHRPRASGDPEPAPGMNGMNKGESD
jgi:hypothetical protein